MKRRLKGRGRYFPGCYYGLLLSLIILLAVLLSGVPLDFVNTKSGSFIGLIVCILIALISFKAGEAIFRQTEKMMHKKYKSMSLARKKAQLFEMISVLLCLVLMMIPGLIKAAQYFFD